MPPKTPRFWESKGGLAALLLPFSCLYYAGHKIKTAFARPYHSRIPVVCVGNVVAGGSGKTPVVHALLALIREHNLYENPVILTRGYGGKLKGPTLVDASVHGPGDVGDEALLHVLHAPTIVSRNRPQGALLAEAMDADIIIMDDGLQNSALQKTLSFLIVDRKGLGNGYMLPAGPLRETLSGAAAKSDVILQPGGENKLDLGRPVYTTSLRIVSVHDKNKEYHAFAGLGRPENFKNTLTENDFRIADFKAFPDHHPYSAADIEHLKSGGRALITTEKDFVRIPEHLREGIEILRVEKVFSDPAPIVERFRKIRQ